MRHLLYLGLILLVGCQNTVGPRERSATPAKLDSKHLTISEQKQRGRDRLALPENSKALVPRDYSDFAGPYNP